MALMGLDHVNIHTADLDGLCRFYEDVLGLAKGPRPSLTRAGAWLYWTTSTSTPPTWTGLPVL